MVMSLRSPSTAARAAGEGSASVADAARSVWLATAGQVLRVSVNGTGAKATYTVDVVAGIRGQRGGCGNTGEGKAVYGKGVYGKGKGKRLYFMGEPSPEEDPWSGHATVFF